jgi:SHS2 domain-containing protein
MDLQVGYNLIGRGSYDYEKEGSVGFRELEHTADWALQVWAPDITGLLVEAARGMYFLMGTTLQEGSKENREFPLAGLDGEMLLVNFLTELLFYGEEERLAFEAFEFQDMGPESSVRAIGGRIQSQQKEIKAVTYHNLQIQPGPAGLEVTIIFDV